MKRFPAVCAALFFVTLSVQSVVAQEMAPDEEGCKESKLLARMPGCRIHSCESRPFDARELVINAEGGSKSLEGTIEQLELVCPVKMSPLQLFRNAEAALEKAGYTLVHSGKTRLGGEPLVTAHKGAQWISVVTSFFNGNPMYTQTAVLVKEMEQQMSAGAQAIAAAISSSGRLDIYGITFATGQATITPQSDQVLNDLLAVLQANREWRLRVESHTDNVGAAAANQKLSDARARAVVEWLTAKGVAVGRLTPAGLGDTQPIGDNKTEDGRAQNRRVVLVKQ